MIGTQCILKIIMQGSGKHSYIRQIFTERQLCVRFYSLCSGMYISEQGINDPYPRLFLV